MSVLYISGGWDWQGGSPCLYCEGDVCESRGRSGPKSYLDDDYTFVSQVPMQGSLAGGAESLDHHSYRPDHYTSSPSSIELHT